MGGKRRVRVFPEARPERARDDNHLADAWILIFVDVDDVTVSSNLGSGREETTDDRCRW